MIVCKVQSELSFVNDMIHLVTGAAARLPEADERVAWLMQNQHARVSLLYKGWMRSVKNCFANAPF